MGGEENSIEMSNNISFKKCSRSDGRSLPWLALERKLLLSTFLTLDYFMRILTETCDSNIVPIRMRCD